MYRYKITFREYISLFFNYAAVVIAMAKKAGLFLRKRNVSMNKSAVELKGDVKKIDKFIRSLPINPHPIIPIFFSDRLLPVIWTQVFFFASELSSINFLDTDNINDRTNSETDLLLNPGK